MVLGVVDSNVYENFSVVNECGSMVAGINTSEFIVDIFNPAGVEVSSTINTVITELSNGHYRIGFVPDQPGLWYLTVYHQSHFPWGKSGEINVYKNDIDGISEGINRVLGLGQENYCLDNTEYTEYKGTKLLTNGRIRIYSNKVSVGTEGDVLATYHISSTWESDELKSYKVARV